MDHPTGIFTISKSPSSTPSQDFAFLRKRMFELLEQLGSGVWTDYNAHDPGITILEALCYSITEIGLRINLPVDQLINGKDPNAILRAFSPLRVLPNHAVNSNDFRHISRGIDKVKNAWLLKSQVPEIAIFVEETIAGPITTYSLNVDAIGPLLRLQGQFDVYFELSDSSLNTNLLLVNTSLLLVDVTPIGIPAIDPVLGPISELYWMELGLPYWDQFPDDWQAPITLNAVTINSLLYDLDAKVFTAGVKVDYNTTQTHSFGIVIRATPLSTSFATVLQIQAFINTVLADLTAIGPYQKLNNKIIAIASQAARLQRQIASHRNLCQDFFRFRSIRIQEIAINTSVELPLPYSIEEICAELFFRLDSFFSPPLQFNSVEELKAEGVHISDIYDGPLNEKGFMRPGTERDWTKSSIFTSDLIHEMLTINDLDPGIKRIIAILDFSINSYINNYPVVNGDRNCVKVIEGSFYRPVFSPIKSDFKFFHEGSEIPYNKEMVLRLFNIKKDAVVIGVSSPVKADMISDLEAVNLGEYYSIQNDFPSFYGIGREGLPGNATVLRQGQANQLKGFLLLFDQMLANASAQTGQLGSFFSFDPEIKNTYFFSSLLNIVPGINDLLVNSQAGYERETALLLENSEQFLVRRNRFQDHLLSITGEDLSEYESVLLNYFARKAVTPADLPLLRQMALERLVDDKNRVLRELPELSGERGLGTFITDHIELFFDTVTAQWKWKLFYITIIANVATRVDLLISDPGFATKRLAFDHLVQHWKELCSEFFYHLNPAIPSFIEVRDKHVPDATSTVLAVSPTTFPVPPLPAEVDKARDEILTIVRRIWNSTNVSGLEKRAGRFLGFRDYRRRDLVNLNFLQYFHIREQATMYAFFLEHEDLPFSLQSSFSYANHAAAEADLAATVLSGMNETKYTTAIGSTSITITLQNGAAVPPIITIPINDNPGTTSVINRVVEFFKQNFGPQEGCFMVEHLLVRPRIKSILPVPELLLTTIRTGELPGHDPYSNRFVTFFLEGELGAFPGHSSRLSDAEFKKLTAKIFQQEAPGHLIGHFIWLKQADMITLQNLYRAWITLLFTANAVEDAFANIQNDLVAFIVAKLQT